MITMTSKSSKKKPDTTPKTEKVNKESTTLPADVNIQPEETAADDALVEKAYEELSGIIRKHFANAMYDVGTYLIKEFYNDDYKLTNKGKGPKEKSLNSLIKKLQETETNQASKTWIYNSINLVADERRFEEMGFDDYKQLGLSQKVYLTHVKDIEKKKILIKETIKKKYTVAQLRDRIGKERDTKPGLIDWYELPAKEVLLERTLKRLEKTEIDAQNELTDFQERILKLESALETLKLVIEEKREMEAKKVADRAAKKKEKAEKKKKEKK
jgi:hypothetical protein